MTHQFSIGDEVEIVKGISNIFTGEVGILKEIDNQDKRWPYYINGKGWASELKLIKKGAGMSEFKVGDKVKFKRDKYVLGTIIENDNEYNGSEYVKLTDGTKYHYSRNAIEKIGDSTMLLKDRIEALVDDFKDEVLSAIDKSGIEKSKVREGLEAEVKELKDKLAGLERKIEEVGR